DVTDHAGSRSRRAADRSHARRRRPCPPRASCGGHPAWSRHDPGRPCRLTPSSVALTASIPGTEAAKRGAETRPSPMLEPRSSACRARQPGMAAMVLIGLFLVCFIGLAASTVTLLLLGSRLRFSFRPIGLLAGAGLSLLSGAIAGTLWRLPSG